MKKEDIEYLESVIFGKIRFNQIGDFTKTLQICNELKSMGFVIKCDAAADLSGTYWADSGEYEVFVQDSYIYIQSDDEKLFQYIEDNGSGKFRSGKFHDLIQEVKENQYYEVLNFDPDSFEITIGTPDYEIGHLPEGFSYDIKEDLDNCISIFGKNESTGMSICGSLNKSYYY